MGHAAKDWRSTRATVVRVSARDERRARKIAFRYDDKDFSLTEAISFAMMERLRIGEVFTFDSDFEQHGFPLVRLSAR